jgi:hypothetical protein
MVPLEISWKNLQKLMEYHLSTKGDIFGYFNIIWLKRLKVH